MAARCALLLLLVAGCASASTPQTMRASDGKPIGCRRVCPPDAVLPERLNALLKSGTAIDVAIYEDCCVGPDGVTWSACAWNASRAMAPSR